ncbi:MAG: DUF58 domain-containing protein [Zoogloeaceae bacterium]|jgi:uncharacterized protein (DUF58 family)|nr:DUF58 domain-containing protein [Zoogloeaceae bacterium]
MFPPDFLRRFIRKRAPEAGTIRLQRQRIHILPTGTGILYAVTLLAMLIGAINYDLGLGHALVFLLASLALVSMVHCHKNLLGLKLRALENPPVHAGETAQFHLLAAAPDARPALEWRIDETPGEETPHPAQILHLPGNVETHFCLGMAARRRGWLVLPRLVVQSRYPLGLFCAWSHPWPEARCLVYPRPIFMPLPPGQPIGKSGAWPSREGDDDFAGLRERQSADSLRHIAWKAAARDGGEKPLLIKLFSGGAKAELWLDWTQLNVDVETRVSLLAGWVIRAEEAGYAYGLSLPGVRFAPARGAFHKHRCLKALALYAPAPGAAAARN